MGREMEEKIQLKGGWGWGIICYSKVRSLSFLFSDGYRYLVCGFVRYRGSGGNLFWRKGYHSKRSSEALQQDFSPIIWLSNILLWSRHHSTHTPSDFQLHPFPSIPFFFFQTPLVSFKLSGTVLLIGSPRFPFSPGWFVPLSIPVLDMPESEATGASPGALPSVWPGALAAPSPCAVGGISGLWCGRWEEGGIKVRKRKVRTLCMLL